jgi:hypothetical protein
MSCWNRTNRPPRSLLVKGNAGWALLKGEAVLSMPEIGIEVPLVEFYEGLEFTEIEQPAA